MTDLVSQVDDIFVDHVDHSVGGFGGHAFRRLTHISMAVVPFLYYIHGDRISSWFFLDPTQFVSCFCFLILVIELVRLKTGIVIVGQREYESNQISALAWGTIAVALALLIAPEGDGSGIESGIYGIPLILGMTIVDPLMGEVKRLKRDLNMAIYLGIFVSYTIWLTCYFWIGTDLIAAILLAPLTVLGELTSSKLIDDNATMVLFPLCGLVFLSPFL
ncbi:MAG: hypothetical protein CMA12_06865 [Euryarchaeota archaeon]|nr:hypothetical protein [Euryarchaeota archaeon]